MSMTQSDLTQAVIGLSKSVQALDAKLVSLQSQVTRHDVRIYQHGVEIDRQKLYNKQLWDAIGTRAVSTDVWAKFSNLESREVTQNKYIEDFKQMYLARNAQISEQLIKLGQSSGGGGGWNFGSGFLSGLGTTGLIVLAGGAYLLLKKR